MIAERMCPLGPLVLAAAGKPPHFSPQRTIDEIRRRGLSVASEQYTAVKGLPENWDAAIVRDRLIAALDAAERYILTAPIDTIGLLAVDAKGLPVEVTSMSDEATFRRATPEPEVMPTLPDAEEPWTLVA
jgi:hypothetical protein